MKAYGLYYPILYTACYENRITVNYNFVIPLKTVCKSLCANFPITLPNIKRERDREIPRPRFLKGYNPGLKFCSTFRIYLSMHCLG